MQHKANKGLFIVFEGGEGSGKSTQMRHLADWLSKNNLSTVITLNPGGTQIGEKIRELLLEPRNEGLGPRTELLLYEADRAQHVDEVVLPALRAGKIVVCDRFADSSTVYQGICRGMGETWTEKLNRFATADTFPDLVIILDIPEKEGRKRIHKRIRNDMRLTGVGRRVKLDRLERERASFHRKVRRGFLKLAQKYPRRLKVLDASRPEEIIAREIQTIVLSKLKKTHRLGEDK